MRTGGDVHKGTVLLCSYSPSIGRFISIYPKNGFVEKIFRVDGDFIYVLADGNTVKPGDLIYFSSGSDKDIYHAAIIVRVEDGEIYYMQNSGPKGERKASEQENMYIVTIKDSGGKE